MTGKGTKRKRSMLELNDTREYNVTAIATTRLEIQEEQGNSITVANKGDEV